MGNLGNQLLEGFRRHVLADLLQGVLDTVEHGLLAWSEHIFQTTQPHALHYRGWDSLNGSLFGGISSQLHSGQASVPAFGDGLIAFLDGRSSNGRVGASRETS